MNNDNMNGIEEAKQEEKLFTQEEVNRIVQARLYERKQAKKADDVAFDDAVSAAVEKATAARCAELDARESRMACREYLLEKGLSSDFLELVPTTDPNEFKEKIEKLSGVVRNSQKYPSVRDGGEARTPTKKGYSNAFSREGSKHKPKVRF